ncbi:MAG: hypothetical protein PHU27_02295 [Salinivirgaceae bacterium]|nr:hypothetical protein [Salinivirgaceae bacterium]MDD4745649.1 hypothetical protein [Salinivirgaceae bacterium]
MILEIETLIENNQLDEALILLQKKDNTLSANQKNKLIGTIMMKKQEYGQALNYFYKILETDPNNKEAKSKIDVIRGILNISNSFYYENTYLDDSLYE